MSRETFDRLLAFKRLHKHKTWEQSIQDLLKIHPHTPSVPRKQLQSPTPALRSAAFSAADADDEEDDVKLNNLRGVVVTRMVTEGGASVIKVPVLLALSSMYFYGRINSSDIVSASQVERMTNSVFQHDAGLLRAELQAIRFLHLQVDLSGRKREERLSAWLPASTQRPGRFS